MEATGPGNWQRTLPPDPGALFAYGTLRFPEVLRELLGRVPELTEGTVADWRVAALTDRTYPGLIRAPGATAAGVLITGLTPAASGSFSTGTRTTTTASSSWS